MQQNFVGATSNVEHCSISETKLILSKRLGIFPPNMDHGICFASRYLYQKLDVVIQPQTIRNILANHRDEAQRERYDINSRIIFASERQFLRRHARNEIVEKFYNHLTGKINPRNMRQRKREHYHQVKEDNFGKKMEVRELRGNEMQDLQYRSYY